MKRLFLILVFILILMSQLLASNNVDRAFTYKEGYLSNGLKFIVVKKSQLPLISFGLMVKSGAYHEKKPGTANLVASTLIYGNKFMRPSTVISKLDYLGASVGVSAQYDYCTLGASFLSSTAERVMKIISRIVRLPSFNKSILYRMKMRTLAALKAQKDEFRDEARMNFYKLIYGKHPYSRDILGTMQSVMTISNKDLFSFYNKYFKPNNSVAVIVGDITFKRAKKIMEKYFSKWKKGVLPQTKTYKIPEIKQRIKILNYPTTQGFVRIGHLSVNRNHPMYLKLLVFNSILGGSGFGSRLTEVIREKLGLTYGIFSNFYLERKYPGYFFIAFSTKLSKIKFSIKKVYEVIDKMIKEGPTAKELANIKKYLRGTFILRRETSSQLISKIMDMELYNLKPYFWEKMVDRINSFTLQDMKEAAKFIRKNKLTVVVIADTSKVKLKKSELIN